MKLFFDGVFSRKGALYDGVAWHRIRHAKTLRRKVFCGLFRVQGKELSTLNLKGSLIISAYKNLQLPIP